ncbi:type II toxin-antitoxin system RelE/ParE family toxin [Rhizobium sp. SAFR-030]|uniref:type II toxin-antitoxin system RelE/ParE family toxin n=1 Tax=Rhizobium sp. SAFR-030 TaxID=3387277 RepID=UPI003F7F766C
MQRYRLKYHPEAEKDLLSIYHFIERYAGDLSARRRLGEIEQTTYRLKSFPKIGTARDTLKPRLRILPCGDAAVICFTVDDETLTVTILCISYAGSDWEARVKERQ